MSFPTKRGGATMWSMSESVQKEARKLAQQMLASGDQILPILSEGGVEVGCVALDENTLLAFAKFQEGGKTFYVGHRR